MCDEIALTMSNEQVDHLSCGRLALSSCDIPALPCPALRLTLTQQAVPNTHVFDSRAGRICRAVIHTRFVGYQGRQALG